MVTNYQVGIDAEARALAYMQKQGFTLVAERYRNQWGEIDLVVTREEELRFIEVKARRSMADGLHAVTPKQQQRIWRCAQGFIAEYPDYAQCAQQIDLIVIAGFQLYHEVNILVA